MTRERPHMPTNFLVSRASRRAFAIALCLTTLALFGGAAALAAPSLSINGTLSQQSTNSSCTFSTMTETAAGNWTVNCGSGTKTITINPKLCGSVCTTYSGLTANAAGNWTVNGCTSPVHAGVTLTQPSTPPPDFRVGTTLRLKATAIPCVGTISKVEFFADGALVPGTVSFVSPSQYEIDWTPTTQKNYPIQAIATDSLSGTTPSQTVNVYANIAPAITAFSVTSPGTSASPPGPRANPATFVLSASATDAAGIDHIEFRRTDGSWVQAASSPYTWLNAPIGTYSVIARPSDTRGAYTDSAPVSLTVTATNNPPTNVQVTKPVAGTSANVPVALEATAQDSDGF